MNTFTKDVKLKHEGEGRSEEQVLNCISQGSEENSRAIHGTVYTKIQTMQLVFYYVYPDLVLF